LHVPPDPSVITEAPAAVPVDVHEPTIDVEFSPDRASGYAALVSLGGEHDLASTDDLRAALDPIFGNVLVDLTRCGFMDSTVIGVLLAKLTDLKREGRRLDLVVPRDNVAIARVVDVVGMRGLLTVHERLPLDGTTAGR
jgi:anti-anti-sigma factor